MEQKTRNLFTPVLVSLPAPPFGLANNHLTSFSCLNNNTDIYHMQKFKASCAKKQSAVLYASDLI